VHVILLDVRYDYNKTSSDRFGEEQLDWLDHAFASNRDSTITIIGSGVQIIPDRWSPIECLSWQNKKHLISLIRKYEKSGVIFISGDVHFS
jgi:phosphodiesterase/alkaline phosphatase D-like protein